MESSKVDRTFQTTDSTLLERNGQAIAILRAIRHADDFHDYEVLPMYKVRFPDGFETEVWRDEIRPWHPRGIQRTVNVESVPD